MSMWTAIVFIVAIAVFARLRELSAQRDRQQREVSLANADLQRELDEMRRRLEVLECIVIDQHTPRRLSHEIEALRDTSPNSEA